jgi:hypothetical protein
MTDKINDETYRLLKKRFDELAGVMGLKGRLGDLWLNYLEGLGCAVVENIRPTNPPSESENFVVCRNPSSPPFGKGFVEEVRIPKETALKAILISDFPPGTQQK